MKDEERKKINKLLDEIQNRSIDKYMEMCYASIIQYPDQLLDYEEVLIETKQNALDNIINYFAQKDMFEKCHKLKLIKEKLKC
tara:strand:- start:17755 stop:18003 length:249 start_codon:yes stop_codon:yes gene_type:complete